MATLDQSQVAGSTLGYAQITANATTTNTTVTAVSGLSVTVTIPSGGRRVKITAFAGGITQSAASGVVEFTLWDGVVGSGTQIGLSSITAPAASFQEPGVCIAVPSVPSAGSKTYNVGFRSATPGTSTIVAGTTNPAFILVELI